MRPSIPLSALVVLLLLPGGLAAQQAPAARTQVMVVRQFKCDNSRIPEFREYVRTQMRPFADQAVREGALLGYGELGHGWGDEWNFVDYFVAADLESFTRAYGEMMQRARERNPDVLRTWQSFCSEHRDNIYNVIHMAPTLPAGRS